VGFGNGSDKGTAKMQPSCPGYQKFKLSETEKGETGEKQGQKHAHHFLWHQGVIHKEFVLESQSQFCTLL
jgi:hypothetical protein